MMTENCPERAAHPSVGETRFIPKKWVRGWIYKSWGKWKCVQTKGDVYAMVICTSR